ncbi:MAG: esterase [Flavobacteriaceae bacterium]|nr:esterase [Flavobacteriaceae bacterium]|tara:strand:+ start:30188 stop:31039 length:852 start_codon:yes stop_codon:yes gene_type:complete
MKLNTIIALTYLKKLLPIVFLLLFQTTVAQKTTVTPFTIGETLTFNSKVLSEERKLNVYLPLSYKDSVHKNYPVIYLLDGSADEDFIHIAGLVQFGSFPWINMIPESIVVGIANVDRKRDFTFPSNNELDQTEFPTSGASANFIRFLTKEVAEIIQEQYRISEESTLIGQSLGGLLATEILYTSPNSFDNYIIISPSLWWDDQSLLQRQTPKLTPPKKVYVAVGNEGPTMEATAMELIAKLQRLRKRETENTLIIRYDIIKEGNHANILHNAVYRALLHFNEN